MSLASRGKKRPALHLHRRILEARRLRPLGVEQDFAYSSQNSGWLFLGPVLQASNL